MKTNFENFLNERNIIVTPISEIENIEELVRQGEVTYRGLGLGKLYDDFFDLANEMGWRINVGKKEYFITDTDFKKIKKYGTIKFSAPYRKER